MTDNSKRMRTNEENRQVKLRSAALTSFMLIAPMLSFALTGSFGIHMRSRNTTSLLTTPLPPTPTPTNVELMNKMERIEAQIEGHGSLIEVQSSTFEATVSRIESNLNLLLAIIAIASVLIALVGYGVVRMWIGSQVEEQISGITSDEISRLTADELSKMRDEWEPRFQELYEEYQRLVRRQDDG